jgi:hypothetical protein
MNQIQRIVSQQVKLPDREELLEVVTAAVVEDSEVAATLTAIGEECLLIQGIKVDNDANEQQAVEHIGKLRRYIKDLNERRLELVKAPTAVVNAINTVFRDLGGDADSVSAELTSQIRGYNTEKRRKAAEAAAAERKAKEEADRKAAEAEAAAAQALAGQAEDAAVEEAVVEAENAQQAAAEAAQQAEEAAAVAADSKVSGQHASSNAKVVLVFDGVIDIAKVPAEFIKVDEKAINRALKKGIAVPGIATREDVEVSIRRK